MSTTAAPPGDIGLIGLGTMGRNLALNIADHGFTVAVYNRTPDKTREFLAAAAGQSVVGAFSVAELLGLLKRPRQVLLLVPAGAPVDEMIVALQPHLEPGDLIIDAGNSHFRETARRGRQLAAQGLLYLGLGVSGGEAGARFGPSLMPGGPWEAYQRVEPILTAVAAKVEGEACVAYLGEGAAGHYVKMVHNGIEYGLMQLIAETYDLLHHGLGLDQAALASIYAAWQQTELESYLLDITVQIMRQRDERTGGYLLAVIADAAGEKGTGIWTSQEGMDLRVPLPTIDAAVSMRALSGLRAERLTAKGLYPEPAGRLDVEPTAFSTQVKDALGAAMLVTYAQGLALLHRASQHYGFNLPLAAVARVWQGGCIIRARLLRDIRQAYESTPELANLLLAPAISHHIRQRQGAWRAVVASAAAGGLPTPGLASALWYVDAYRRARLPTNLIQAQRDYFGAHTYERLDAPGRFHTEWPETNG